LKKALTELDEYVAYMEGLKAEGKISYVPEFPIESETNPDFIRLWISRREDEFRTILALQEERNTNGEAGGQSIL
jgi:hypothetical protein